MIFIIQTCALDLYTLIVAIAESSIITHIGHATPQPFGGGNQHVLYDRWR